MWERLNPNPERLRVGDRVQTDLRRDLSRRTLTILEIRTDRNCGSGRWVVAGHVNPRSGRNVVAAEADSAWFRPAARTTEPAPPGPEETAP